MATASPDPLRWAAISVSIRIPYPAHRLRSARNRTAAGTAEPDAPPAFRDLDSRPPVQTSSMGSGGDCPERSSTLPPQRLRRMPRAMRGLQRVEERTVDASWHGRRCRRARPDRVGSRRGAADVGPRGRRWRSLFDRGVAGTGVALFRVTTPMPRRAMATARAWTRRSARKSTTWSQA